MKKEVLKKLLSELTLLHGRYGECRASADESTGLDCWNDGNADCCDGKMEDVHYWTELDGALRARSHWNISEYHTIQSFNRSCWIYYYLKLQERGGRQITNQGEDGKFARLFCSRIPEDGADLGSDDLYCALSSEALSALQSLAGAFWDLPLSCFRFVIDPFCYQRSKPADGAVHFVHRRDLLFYKLRQLLLHALEGCRYEIPGCYGLTCREEHWLRQQDPDYLDYLIFREHIRLELIIPFSFFDQPAYLARLKARSQEVRGEDKKMVVQYVRMTYVQIMTQMLGLTLQSLEHCAAPAVRAVVSMSDDLVMNEQTCRELLELGFTPPYVAQVLSLTKKIVSFRKNRLDSDSYARLQKFKKRWKYQVAKSEMEFLSHETLLTNCLILVELLYQDWQASRYLHSRKVIAAIELYYRIIGGADISLPALSIQEICSYLTKLGQHPDATLVSSDLCRTHHELIANSSIPFYFPYMFMSYSCNCVFCRKILRSAQIERLLDITRTPGKTSPGCGDLK